MFIIEEDPFVEKPQSSSESSSPKTEKAEEKPDEPKENGLAEDKKAVRCCPFLHSLLTESSLITCVWCVRL